MEVVLIIDDKLTEKQIQAFNNREKCSFEGIPYKYCIKDYECNRLGELEDAVNNVFEQLPLEVQDILRPHLEI